MIVITLHREHVWQTLICCFVNLSKLWMVMHNISTVSESMDVDCCRGGGWGWDGGIPSDWWSLRLSTAFMLTPPQLCSADPHHAKTEKKMRGWAYSGRKWKSPNTNSKFSSVFFVLFCFVLTGDWLHYESVVSKAKVKWCYILDWVVIKAD